ncbi:DUF488 domain-containing protein [Sphingobacterium thalpophilum]|uniref:DUF488 domain-containing protein n=1 Tax=Sphingobacterium thalpophilum TaxID=259 RepID=A0A4U9UG92_9SPHI|nr:DUF488 domain-containing protein [Sphingobacterium thalpophilum]VTR28504.1 Uncharacterized conserved protein [Sphingobacterium thalpophilum]
MEIQRGHIIYTIGHSTHSLEDFVHMLQSFHINHVVDIRRFPGSKKFPQFDKENFKLALRKLKIDYNHLEGLGGRRNRTPGYTNSRWRNTSFRNYAAYMETDEFRVAISRLIDIASDNVTAYMCSEAVWWRCHRALVSDYLKAKGWTVLHIMATGKSEEHPYTSPANVIDGKVYYSDDNIHD